jgi:23S rRNA G2445 N2-methylase RlmL
MTLLTKIRNVAKYGATVTTGLEAIARSELRHKLQIEANVQQGKILFETDRCVKDLLKLKTINNLFVIVYDESFNDNQMPGGNDHLERFLMEVGDKCDWRIGLLKWSEVSGFECDIDKILTKDKSLRDVQPKFRVSSHRFGLEHNFTSPEICTVFGHVIDTKFGWPIKMKDFDLEVNANFCDNHLCVCITLTPECLASRHIKVSGLTTLKAVYCYAMLKLANVQTGEIVLDPMAGTGAIPVDVCYNWLDSEFHSFALAGELRKIDLDKCSVNLDISLEERRPPSDKMRLDVRKMPLRDESVDVIASDLPFGRRHGSKQGNKTLYPAMLRDMGRVARLKTGRAVLLTQDKHAMHLASVANRDLWTETSSSHVKVGNLHCYIYLFRRNKRKFDHNQSSHEEKESI